MNSSTEGTTASALARVATAVCRPSTTTMPAAPTFQAVCTSDGESPTMTTRSGLTPTCSASSRNPPGSGLGASPPSPQLMPSTHPASASVSSSNVVGLPITGGEYSDLDSGGGQLAEGASHIADRNQHSLSRSGDLLYDATAPLVPKIAQRRHHFPSFL